jgi:hypothetical protein
MLRIDTSTDAVITYMLFLKFREYLDSEIRLCSDVRLAYKSEKWNLVTLKVYGSDRPSAHIYSGRNF